MTSETWRHQQRRHGPGTTENDAELTDRDAEPVRPLPHDLAINQNATPDTTPGPTAPDIGADATSNATRPPRAHGQGLRVVGVDTEPLDPARHHEAVTALAALIDQWHHHTGTEVDVQNKDARTHDSHASDSRAA